MEKNFVAIIIFLISHSAYAGPEIVQIDTGIHSNVRGALVMDKSKISSPMPAISREDVNRPARWNAHSLNFVWYIHGTQMAEALLLSAIELNMAPIRGEQLGYRNYIEIVQGIRQATALKPKVITMSLAGESPLEEERLALRSAVRKGILVLAASGNEHKRFPSFPASYNLPCLISVSTIENGAVPDYANEGDIYVSIFGDEHGTSFSTARAGAFAVQYFRKYPKATCHQAKLWLLKQFPRPDSDGSTQPKR